MLLQLVKWGFRITYIGNTFVLPLNAFESKIKKSIKPGLKSFWSILIVHDLNFFPEKIPIIYQTKEREISIFILY